MLPALENDGYVVVEGFIDRQWAGILYDMLLLRQWRKEFKRDDQVREANSHWGDCTLDAILVGLLPDLERAAGCALLPTYSYARLYSHGQSLPRHRDRAAAEIAVTVHLGYLGATPPPIRFAPDVAVYQQPGDAVLYLGDRIEHWRDTFDGENFGQMFLNYVRADGPRKAFVYDGRRDAFPPSPQSIKAPLQMDGARCPTVLREDGLVVIDDVLPPAVFRSLGREVSHGDYRSVHAQKWDRVWRVWDGHPMRGESVSFDPDRVFAFKGANYPTGTSVDALVDYVRRMSASFPEVAGAESVDWAALYLAPWIYPVGSGLSLHQDSERYSGSFTFFLHSRWRMHWGGELLVSRGPSNGGPSALSAFESHVAEVDDPWMSDDSADEGDSQGIATCVSPKPNRLVLIGPDRPHRIARVDQNAGAHVRASIAGFFLRSP